MALRYNSHRIVVLLAIEDDIETGLVELLHRDAIWTLSKHRNLVDARLLVIIGIGPLALTNLWRRDKAQDLQ